MKRARGESGFAHTRRRTPEKRAWSDPRASPGVLSTTRVAITSPRHPRNPLPFPLLDPFRSSFQSTLPLAFVAGHPPHTKRVAKSIVDVTVYRREAAADTCPPVWNDRIFTFWESSKDALVRIGRLCEILYSRKTFYGFFFFVLFFPAHFLKIFSDWQ